MSRKFSSVILQVQVAASFQVLLVWPEECSRVQLEKQKMSGYKLHYFPIRGGGEISRLSFAAANIEFEDIRLEGEAWAKEKACR